MQSVVSYSLTVFRDGDHPLGQMALQLKETNPSKYCQQFSVPTETVYKLQTLISQDKNPALAMETKTSCYIWGK